MTKKEVEQKVSEKINPLLTKLAEYEDGPCCMEEYGRSVWDKDAVIKICQEVFNETYNSIIK